MPPEQVIVILCVVIAVLIGAAAGYHLRPGIIRYTGGAGDEAATLALLQECKAELQQIKRELRHAQQLIDVYKELNDRRKIDE